MKKSSKSVRISKLIASRGLASRREAETWLTAGRVVVNGDVVTAPGSTADPEKDHIRVDGKALPEEPPRVYVMLNKPRGYITGRNDPEGRKSVLDLVKDLKVRVEPVGRLDCDTEGLLILTNDGDLAHALTHPSSEVPKRYHAKVWRIPTDGTLQQLQTGVFLPDGKTAPAKARIHEATDNGNAWLEITVTEGRNRLVRRMCQAMNHPVSKLRRVSFGTLSLKGLERGEYRMLTAQEISRLKDISEGKKPAYAGKGQKYRKGFARPKPKKRRPGQKKRDARRTTR